MAIKPLNSVAGFSVGEYPTTVVVDTSGNVSANGLTVARTANLGAIGNITITGGLPGQFLQTDGTGILSWQTVSAASLSNGTSNIQILDSGNVTISSAGTPNVLVVTSTGAYITGNVSATNGTFSYVSGNGSALSSLTGANVTGTVANAAYAILSGTVTTNAQPNITSVGTLTSLSVTGNSSSGNVNTIGKVVANTLESNVSTGTAPFVVASTTKVSNLNADLLDGYDTSSTATANSVAVRDTNGNLAANFFIGNGSQLTGLPSGTSIANGTSNVSIPVASGNVNITANGTTTLIVSSTGANVTGNLSAGNITSLSGVFIGNGSGLTSLTGANVTGTVANATYATNAGTATTVTANAQPNITSVGTLSSVSVTGNVTSASGVFIGNGAGLTNINGSNVTGTVASANNATYAVNVTGNSQPNITSVGNLSSLTVTGNLTAGNVLSTNTITSSNGIQITSGGLTVSSGNLNVTGNINVTGNLNYSNVTDLVVGDPLIYIGANNTGDLFDLGLVGSYNEGIYYHTGIARDHTTNYWTFFDGVVQEPTTVIDWANATYPTVKLGSLIATSTASITGNANVGNLGTVGLIVATGNITGGNLNTTGALSVTGNANVGNLGAATAVFTVGNITTINSGLVQNGNSNITITPNGNITLSATGSPDEITITSTGVNVAGTLQVSNNTSLSGTLTVSSTTTLSGGTFNHTGSSSNITSSTGNVTATLAGGATVSGNTKTIGIGTGGVVGSTTTISIGSANGTTISVAGVTSFAGNVTLSSGILAGNGSGLTALTGSNVTGTVANATYATSAGTATTATTAATAASASSFLSNTTSSGTYYLPLVTSTVDGYYHAWANAAFSVNVSNGSISATTFVGNVSGASAILSSNLALGNTTIRWATATTSSITSNQTIASVSTTGVTGVEFLVKSIDASGSKYSVSTVQAVTDGTNVDFSTFGTVNLGGFTGELSVSIVTGSINLQVTPASSNSTVWTTQYRLI